MIGWISKFPRLGKTRHCNIRQVRCISQEKTPHPQPRVAGGNGHGCGHNLLGRTCQAFGTPGHSWQITAQSGMGIGHKGMLYAGKVMALTAIEFMTKPELVKEAQEEFEKIIKKMPYICPIIDGVKPF